MDATATLNTLGLLDTVDGGAGTDTLTVINTTANAVATALTAASVTNIENFVYMATAGGDLDFDDAGSATNFSLTVLGASDFADVRTTDTVTIVNGGAAMDSTFNYNATNVAGTADAHAIAITSITAGAELTFAGDVETMTLNVNGAASLADLDFDAGTTTVIINAAAALTVTANLTNAGVTTYTVTGAGAVDLDAAAGTTLGTAVTAYNAATATGAQSILAGVSNITITGGSAADVIDMAATLTANDTINGGAGADTLRVDLDSAGTAPVTDMSITNIETIRFDAIATAAGAINLDNVSFTNVRFDQGTTQALADQVITLTDITASVVAFNFIGLGEADDDVFFSPVTIDYDTTTDVAAITLAFTNAGVVADDIRVGAITVDNVDVINITASDVGAAAADELTIDDLIADATTDLVVTSNGKVIFSGLDGDVLDTIDFSGIASGVTAQLDDAAAAVSVTLGAGNDTFVATTNSGAITITLGAGNDAYTSSTGVDTITTGAGVDTVTFIGDATDSANVIADFTAGAGGDIFDFTTNAAQDGGVTLSNTETITGAADDVAEAGLIFFTGADADALTAAGISDRLNDMGDDNNATAADNILTYEAATDDFYGVMTDGTNTVVFLAVSDADTTVEADEITIIATLSGISDVSTLTAANFADFL